MGEGLDYTPEENTVKEYIAELIPKYSESKLRFFLNASKDDDQGKAIAGAYYGELITQLYALLEFSKPDNINIIIEIDEAIENLIILEGKRMIGEKEIKYLKDLCTWTDTNPLFPHFKTQPPILDL